MFFLLITALALLNGTGSLSAFPIQIGASVPTGGSAPVVDPSLIITGVVGAVAAFNTLRTHRNKQSLDAKHEVSDDRTKALATGLSSVLTSLKATDVAGKDQSVIINQLVQALNTVPAVSEALNKPIKDVAPSVVQEGDATICLTEKADQNAKNATSDIQTYYNNKPALPGDTSVDPVVKAVAEVQKQTMVTDD